MWMQNIDSSSGISKQAVMFESVFDSHSWGLTTLKIIFNVVQNARGKENKKIVFNLTLDEMSIRKRIDWDGQKSHGFIDIGTRFTLLVLVFLVAINDKFKLPIAYYFTDQLNGHEKAKLLKTALCALYENNIDVVSITFDGAASNISMCQELGAHLKSTDIENNVPYFDHPTNECKRIRIFCDACHMIKLVRNTIATYDLTDNDDRTISWKYVKQLVFLQNEEKLHPAVKVSNRHIYFKNEKMKVSLAEQVLSMSVYDALQFLEHDLKFPQFVGAEGTAIFCKIFNFIFDLLNSKNLYAKTEMKKAISRDNVTAKIVKACTDNLFILKDKINEFISYIKSLKMQNTSVLQSKRKIGFIGFIIDLQNIIALAEELFNKISQAPKNGGRSDTFGTDLVYRTDKLLQQKNRGSLCQPSHNVIVVCKTAEKTLRSNQHILFKTKNILHVLIRQSERLLSNTIFHTDNHIFRQEFDHQSQLIRLILKTFFNVRLKHETTTYINWTPRVRMRNNRLTL
ncbi:THAP domain-containing protein 9 [Cyphomyrmex costatus]|uniref:THAP domain-containing protein 9 n=1 Tax=Cyphomyrmex costatus TaxID=456900 RepID=A0A151IQ36_9HYME|nr:THAP domain-containing protein 9 [Cyphomyrmex costatus]